MRIGLIVFIMSILPYITNAIFYQLIISEYIYM